ncbi:phage major capsid protein [Vibrio sp. SM6]|uniref:Phage major capsid protein n=1 Tax=Vibrio agarilyticus TaxID=2726741 RepID=A0A7X8TQK8_9VIBR|nr:phage major capsid protein [Vibrio agarilyticus]NLS13011.1 phage major capsid protein [Vibrio agarilyticus]
MTPLIKRLHEDGKKELNTTSGAATIQQQLTSSYIEKALDNDVLLSRMAYEVANSPKFSKPVLKIYTSVQDGTEGQAPTKSTDPVYIQQNAIFHKNESLVSVTHEIIQDSQVNVVQHVFSQVGNLTAVKMQDDLLNDNIDFGLANYCIDKEGQHLNSNVPYQEAIKSDNDRDDYVFQVHKSGVDHTWGGDTQSKIRFMIDLIKSVPSRYQMAEDFAIYMNRENWFSEFNFITENTGDNVNHNITPYTWQGYKVVIIDNLADDVIFVGSLMNAYSLLSLNGSVVNIEDEITEKGLSQYYTSNRFSGLLLDNTAIRFGVKAA